VVPDILMGVGKKMLVGVFLRLTTARKNGEWGPESRRRSEWSPRKPEAKTKKERQPMTKTEFDELSAKMFPGVSGCADYMWEEIERTYMGTEISKEGMVKVYWKDPGMYRVLRDAADKRAELEREVVETRKRAAAAEAEVRELLEQKHRLQAELAKQSAIVRAVREAVA